MDENRLEGTARNIGGKIQEGVGDAAGDTKIKTEGLMNQAAGTAQDLYGQTTDVARQLRLHSMPGCGTLLKLNLTRLPSSRWESAGCSVDYNVFDELRCNELRR